MYKDSLHKKMLEQIENRTIGFDYKKDPLIYKFVSPIILQNPRLNSFLTQINSYLVEMLDLIKYYQFYFNFTIDKNDKRYNI
jgi:hypothetical protein